jgi:hypothetical protein
MLLACMTKELLPFNGPVELHMRLTFLLHCSIRAFWSLCSSPVDPCRNSTAYITAGANSKSKDPFRDPCKPRFWADETCS